MTVAALIQDAAASALALRGEPATQAAVAALLGVTDQEWGRWVNGRRKVDAARVPGWLATLAEHGIVVAVRADGGGWATA